MTETTTLLDKGDIVMTCKHKLADYHRYSSGLHEILLYSNSRKAVDKIQEYFELMYIQHIETREPYFIVTDAGNNTDIPLRHIFSSGRALLKRYPTIVGGGRAVYLFERSPLVTALDLFLKLLRGSVERRYLNPEERDDAIQWLLQGLDQYKRDNQKI